MGEIGVDGSDAAKETVTELFRDLDLLAFELGHDLADGEMYVRQISVFLTISLISLGGCSSSGGSVSDGGTGSGGNAGPPGAELFSCTITASGSCTQLLIPSTGSTLSTEQQTCTTTQNGTSGKGCATAGLIGCCLPKPSDPSQEEQCYYSADAASVGQAICTSPHIWSTGM